MNWISNILNAGGRLLIKEYTIENIRNDVISLTLSTEIDGHIYHKAILFNSIQRMNDAGDEVAEAFLVGLDKLKQKLLVN